MDFLKNVLGAIGHAAGGAVQGVEHALGINQPQPQPPQQPTVTPQQAQNVEQAVGYPGPQAGPQLYPSIQDQIAATAPRVDAQAASELVKGKPGATAAHINNPNVQQNAETNTENFLKSLPVLGNAIQFAHDNAQANANDVNRGLLPQVGEFAKGITGTGIATTGVPALVTGAAATFTPTEQINNPVTNWLSTGRSDQPVNSLARAYDEANGPIGKALAVAGDIAPVLGIDALKPGVRPVEPVEGAASDVARPPVPPQTSPEAAGGVPGAQAVQPPRNGYEAAQQALNSSYGGDYTADYKGGLQEVTGRVQAGKITGDELSNQVKVDLPNALDRKTLADYLDSPSTVDAPANVRAVADRIQPILAQADEIRQTFDPNYKSVQDYFTRAMKGADSEVNTTFQDAHPTTASKYSQSRQVVKLKDTATGDTLIGNIGDLKDRAGIKPEKDGNYVDGEGHTYEPVQATREELRQNGMPLEDDAAKVLSHYLADTNRVKEHGLYLEAIADKYGFRISDAAGVRDASGMYNTTAPKPIPDGYRLTRVKGLENVAFPNDTADLLDGMVAKGADNLLTKGLKGTNDLLRDIALTNPVVHPINLTIQAYAGAGITRGPRLTGEIAKTAATFGKYKFDPLYKEMTEGGANAFHLGMSRAISGTAKFLAGGSKEAAATLRGLDNFNPINWGRAFVNQSDEALRFSLYKTLRETGFSKADATVRVNKVMGDYAKPLVGVEKTLGHTVFLYRWLKTESTTLGLAATNPKVLASMAFMGATILGLQDELRKQTGNPNATVRFPGAFGLIKDALEIPYQLHQGQEPTLVAGHTFPAVQRTLEQFKNENLFTGKQIHQGPGFGLGDRARELAGQTLGQSAPGRFASGSKSIGEKALNFFGVGIPHVKDAPGAPNIPALNMPGTTPSTGPDPTGVKQAAAYAQTTREDITNKLTNQKDIDAYKIIKDKLTDPDTGKPMLNSPLETMNIASTLKTNPNVLNALQQQAQDYADKTGQPLDPKWALAGSGVDANGKSASKLQIFTNYQSLPEASADQVWLKQQNPWISQLQSDRTKFFTDNPLPPSKSVANPNTPQYPVFDPQTQAILSQYNSANASQKTALIQNYPQLADAFSKIGAYTIAVQKAQDVVPSIPYPTVSAQVQAALKAKNYKAPGVQDYLTAVTMYNIAKGGEIAFKQGGQAPANYLKDIYNAGNYDITKNADGSYSIKSSASGSGSSGSYKYWRFKGYKGTPSAKIQATKPRKIKFSPGPGQSVKLTKSKVPTGHN